MSFILDALRKVDSQRNAAGEPVGPRAVSVETIRRERARRRRQLAGMAGIALVSAIVTAAGLSVLFRTRGEPSAAPEAEAILSERLPEETPPPPEELPVAAVVPEPVPETPEEGEPEPVAYVGPERELVSVPEPEPLEPEALETEGEPEQRELESEEPEPVVEQEIPATQPGTIRVIGKTSPARFASDAGAPPPPPRHEGEAEEALPAHFPRLVLQGTSVIDGKPVAVISDRRVFEGDRIEGALVVRIEERSVELELDGRRFTISL